MSMKRFSLLLMAFLITLILFSTSLLFFQGSQAASKPVTSQHRQRVLFPTRGGQPHQQGTVTPPTPPYGSGDLTWHNGNFATNPQAYLIFWGPGWSAASPEAQLLESYFTDVSGTSFESILTQYYQSGNHIANTENLAGVWFDGATPPTDTTCGTHTIEDAALENEVKHAVTTNGWPDLSWDATYFVYTPNGYLLNDGAGDCSEQVFCGYHSYTTGTYSVENIYAAIPYPSNLANCGVPTAPSGNRYADSLVNITSHEQFEAITDPDLWSGWYDSVGFEIADKCAWDFAAGLTHLNNGSAFEIQEEYSNLTSTCMNTYTPAPRFQASVPMVALTATPGISPSPFSLLLTNRGTATLNWSAGSLPSWVSVSPTSGTLTPTSAQSLSLTFTLPPTSPTPTYTTTLVLTDQNAVYSPFAIPITLVLANVSRQWYFAEGYTGGSFSEFLTLANPNNLPATVQVRYLLDTRTPITKLYQVGANARSTINVNTEIGSGQNVSMVVTATEPIIAERPMYFTYTGLPGYTIPGGSDVLGATGLSTSFDFGYLDTTSGHDTYLTILNQNNSQMTATIQYFAASGGAPTTLTHTVNANSRGTVHVNAEGLVSGTYSALVTLSEPGLVERPLYLKDSTTHYTGSADVVGVATPQTDWYFAEGFTNPTFFERYILSNPTTSGSADVMVTFFNTNGSPVTTSVTLAPGQQDIIDANTVLGNNNVSNSAHVHSSLPILAERFISFTYTGSVGQGGNASIPGASDVLGGAAPSNLFYFSEGYTGSTFAEYLTIENPSATDAATVQITFLPANGAQPTVLTYLIPASTRFTLFTNQVLPNQSFSMAVQSDIPIMAERPMYFTFTGGQTGGSDVVGYQPPGALPSTGLTLYAGASTGYLYAIDANTGNTRWGYHIGTQILDAPTVANGMVYVGSDDTYLYALHASDGSLAWRYQTGGAVRSTPQVANGVVYFGSQDGYVYALNASTGALIWRFHTSGGIYASPAVANGVVYIGSDDDFVYALDASNGTLIWSFQTGSYVQSAPAVAGGVVYIGSDDRHFYALNASTGAVFWNYNDTNPSANGISYGNPVVSAGVVYVPVSDGNVDAFNASTGTITWHQQAGTSNTGPIALAIGNGAVYVASADAHLYVFDASTGTPLWNVQAGGVVPSVAVTNGAVYFGSSDGFLHALDASDSSLLWGYFINLYAMTSLTVGP